MRLTIPVARKSNPGRRGYRMTPERREELRVERERRNAACLGVLGVPYSDLVEKFRRRGRGCGLRQD